LTAPAATAASAGATGSFTRATRWRASHRGPQRRGLRRGRVPAAPPPPRRPLRQARRPRRRPTTTTSSPSDGTPSTSPRSAGAAPPLQDPQVPLFFRRRIAGADLRVPPYGRDAEDGEPTLGTRGSREGRTTWRWRGRRWGCTYSLGSDAGARGAGQI
jgi:hypothetical protein